MSVRRARAAAARSTRCGGGALGSTGAASSSSSHAVDAEGDLVGDDPRNASCHSPKRSGSRALDGEHADQAVPDQQRERQRALRVGQAGQRDLRAAARAAVRHHRAPHGAAVAQARVEPAMRSTRRSRATVPISPSPIATSAPTPLAVAAAGDGDQPLRRLVGQQHHGVLEAEVVVERVERRGEQRLEIVARG